VKPFLTEVTKTVVENLDPSKSSYKDIKEALLREYKMSTPMCRENSMNWLK